MRKWHRWLSVLFGLLILFIAVTGLLGHGAALYRDSLPADAAAASPGNALVPAARAHDGMPAAAPAPTATAVFTCPADMTCRAKPAPDSAAAWTSYFHHLHAGEEFGPIGTALSILSGFALIFFAFSGLWMYIEMFRRRSHRKSHPREVFWP